MNKEELQELLQIIMVAYKRSAFELEETPIVINTVSKIKKEISLLEEDK